MANEATIDISNHAFLYGGLRVTGFGPGTPLTVVYNVNQNQVFTGVDGLAAFVKNKGKAAAIQIELMPNAAFNAVLSAALLADEATPGGLVVPISIRDKSGPAGFATKYAARASKVEKMADYAVGDGINVRVWRLLIGKLRGFVGGVALSPEHVPELPTT